MGNNANNQTQILPPNKKIEIGLLIKERYLVEKELGRGGMGEVFKIMDIADNKVKAIKRMFGKDEKSRIRFKLEYTLLSKVEHANLVKAYDWFEEKDDLFMVLEFVDGQSLGSILRKIRTPFSLQEKLAIAIKAARGIEILHKAGIVHRDIKPDNIMVNIATGDVKLLDLGVAKDFTQDLKLTKTGGVVGTVSYMSPEQLDGRSISFSSDVFSFGITLYQLFLWQPKSPFSSEISYESMTKICDYEPPTLYKDISSKENLSEKEIVYIKAISKIIEIAMNVDFRGFCKKFINRVARNKSPSV